MSQSVPFRKDSYRNPSGLPSESGYGYGKNNGTVGAARAREAERRSRILAATEPSEPASAAWAAVTERLQARIRRATWGLWFAPLRLAGEHDGALVIVGPSQVVSWVERRYGSALGDAIREQSDYRGLFVFEAEAEAEGEGCL